jgi:hypothetical protein
MKPLNLDNSPCAPQSSNCVIWQGPNIPCIKLCTGDTISDVTYKLATELCTIMSELNLTNYDLSCLNLTTSEPTNFNELIQLLISKICELENIPTNTTPGSGGCPDCVVTVATCFQTGTQTTMQLLDYVTAIANKVCAILLQITAINANIDALEERVTFLENNPPPVPEIPYVSTTCPIGTVVPDTDTPINIVVTELINNPTNGYCSLLGATGSPAVIAAAIGVQLGIVTGADPSYGTPGNTMIQSYPFWITSPGTISASITNMWYSIGDIRTALSSLIGVNVVADTSPNSGAVIPVPGPPVLGVKTFTVSSKTSVVLGGSGITVTPVTTGDGLKTTYTVGIETFGADSYSNTPAINPLVTPTNTTTVFADGIQQPMNITIYSDGIGTWTSTTGIWAATVAGRYNIGFRLRMSFPSTGFTSGMVIVAAVGTGTGAVYASSTVTVNQATKTIELSGSALGTLLAVGQDVQIRVLNATDKNYVVVPGDIVSMTIQRIK